MNTYKRCTLLLVLTLLLTACLPLPPSPARQASLTTIRADVLLREGDKGALVPPGEVQPLAVGQTIQINESGRARLRFLNYLLVEVFLDSDLHLESMTAPDAPPAYRFKLEAGTLYAAADAATELVRVESDLAVIVALGTQFWVYVAPGEITWVLCKEGQVQITAQGRTVIVPEGYQAWVVPDESPFGPFPAYRSAVGGLIPPIEELTGGEFDDDDVFVPEGAVPPTPGPVPRCTVASYWLSLRSGPGTAYGALRLLSKGTELEPLAYVSIGHPSGSWMRVRVLRSNQQGWAPASAPYVSCNVDVTRLPPGSAPATPTPAIMVVTPTVTPTPWEPTDTPTATPTATRTPTPTPMLY